MSCCCQNIYKFCNPVNICDADSFKAMFSGLADGNYTIELNFLGSVKIIELTKAGDVITIPEFNFLNEKYTYTGKVKNGSDTVSLVYDETEYDCFEFTTTLVKTFPLPEG